MSEEVKKLANEEVDYAISMLPEFANLFRNETIDRSRMGCNGNQIFIWEQHGRQQRIFSLLIMLEDFDNRLTCKII
jgi:hypothetical protein